MGARTHIQWCDHSYNHWIGCTKVSPGCAHCYAEHSAPVRVARAQGAELWGKGRPRILNSDAYHQQLAQWDRAGFLLECLRCGHRRPKGQAACGCGSTDSVRSRQRVFVASLSDWLDPEVPWNWRRDLMRSMGECPNLDFLALTKRPEEAL